MVDLALEGGAILTDDVRLVLRVGSVRGITWTRTVMPQLPRWRRDRFDTHLCTGLREESPRTSSYRSVILQDKLGQSKATTHGIERNHCGQRHWCGHGKRQSIHLSKSYAIVDLTVALFARF